MGSLNFEKQVFIGDASVKYGWSIEETRRLLRERYETFDPDLINEYDNYLADIKSRTIAALSSDKPKVVHIKDANCPICGAPIVNDDKWFGKYTRTPGWSCTNGGTTHFLWWKANNIRRKQGLPIVFEEHEGSGL